MNRAKLLFVVNDAPFFISHRLPLALAARDAGYEVAIACPSHPSTARFAAEDLRFFSIPIPRSWGGFAAELAAAKQLGSVLRSYRPSIAHLITAKPIIYGGILCRLFGIPVVAAVSGLGHAFVRDGFRARCARFALLVGYFLALYTKRALIIFQNVGNRAVFEKAGIVGDRAVMIRGSGADLGKFDPTPSGNEQPAVVLPARMLWTKGVGEFVEAAKLLRSERVAARFILAGDIDPGNPACVELEQLEQWNSGGVVEWIGYCEDIAGLLRSTDIVALPSYYPEGLPKTLVDAAAAGRVSVTTDTPGCRDAVVPGETGLLVRPRDSRDLAEKIALLVCDRRKREEMGRAARAFAEREFDIERIAGQHLACYEALVPLRSVNR